LKFSEKTDKLAMTISGDLILYLFNPETLNNALLLDTKTAVYVFFAQDLQSFLLKINPFEVRQLGHTLR
jgi:hypothetical protein